MAIRNKKARIGRAVQAEADRTKKLALQIHALAEPSGQETQSVRLVADYLAGHGFEPPHPTLESMATHPATSTIAKHLSIGIPPGARGYTGAIARRVGAHPRRPRWVGFRPGHTSWGGRER